MLLESLLTILVDLTLFNILVIETLNDFIPVVGDLISQLDFTTLPTEQQAITP